MFYYHPYVTGYLVKSSLYPKQPGVLITAQVMLWGLSKNDFYDCRLPERLKFEVHHPQSRNALQILFGRTNFLGGIGGVAYNTA